MLWKVNHSGSSVEICTPIELRRFCVGLDAKHINYTITDPCGNAWANLTSWSGRDAWFFHPRDLERVSEKELKTLCDEHDGKSYTIRDEDGLRVWRSYADWQNRDKWVVVRNGVAGPMVDETTVAAVCKEAEASGVEYSIWDDTFQNGWPSLEDWEGRDLGKERAAVWPVRRKLVEGKLKHDVVPPVALIELAKVMQGGAAKYGKFNWRESGIDIADYYSAIQRHLLALMSGVELDPESGLHQMAHVMANCAIVLDWLALKKE